MSDEFYIGHSALEKLSSAFSREADQLGEHLAKFKPKTDSEAIHDGFGFLTESEEVTSAYIELAEQMTKAIEGLQDHAYAIAENLKKNSHNSVGADKAIEEQFKGGNP